MTEKECREAWKKYQIEWEADENMWGGVIAMINSGTSVVESVVSR